MHLQLHPRALFSDLSSTFGNRFGFTPSDRSLAQGVEDLIQFRALKGTGSSYTFIDLSS